VELPNSVVWEMYLKRKLPTFKVVRYMCRQLTARPLKAWRTKRDNLPCNKHSLRGHKTRDPVIKFSADSRDRRHLVSSYPDDSSRFARRRRFETTPCIVVGITHQIGHNSDNFMNIFTYCTTVLFLFQSYLDCTITKNEVVTFKEKKTIEKAVFYFLNLNPPPHKTYQNDILKKKLITSHMKTSWMQKNGSAWFVKSTPCHEQKENAKNACTMY